VQDDDIFARTAHEALLRALARTADARRRQGRDLEAERLYHRALDLAEDVFGSRHPEVAAILTSLAALKDARGERTEAEALRRRVSEIRAEGDVAKN
jgi:hypothetical protein